jgi:2-amino-4-hydroxy-6-hydroxymethyldihydropteridine diphosphokinase
MTETVLKTNRDYDATLGLGSNVGDKAGNIARALELLEQSGDIKIVRRSSNYRSAPWGVTDQDWFVNACVAVTTPLSVDALLQCCLRIEDDLGRVRQQKWGPRLIDVDLLTYRGETISQPHLKVPHPYIEERNFVVVPLAEIAPAEVVRGKRVSELAAHIDRSGLVIERHK